VGLGSLALLADEASVRIVHPFTDAGFAAALATLPKPSRYTDRTAAMRLLFGDLLPDEVLARTTKSSFDEAFWSDWSRALAADWSGAGADPELVDVEALHREWSGPEPDPRSFTQVQAAWLAENQPDQDVVRASPTTSTTLVSMQLPYI
jgi:asparagine synthase (glutamine-hydrolysing)